MDTFQAYLIEGTPARTSARFVELSERDLDPGEATRSAR